MKIKKRELLKALTLIKPGHASNDIVEGTDSFIFAGDEILTYDDRVCIGIPFSTDFSCSVKVDEFFSIIQKIKDEDVQISLKKNKLKIIGGDITASLNVDTELEILDLIDTIQTKKWHKLPGDFKNGLKLCMFSVSKDASQPILSSVIISDNRILSSDDSRITEYTMDMSIDDLFLIPLSSIVKLIKFDIIEYCKDDAWVSFKTKDGIIFSSRIISVSDDDIETILDTEKFFDFEGDKVTIPSNLIDAIDSASILAEGEFDIDKSIEIAISDKDIKCKGEKDIGWVQSKGKLKKGFGGDICFKINPIFFKEMIQVLDQEEITIKCEEKKLLFESDKLNHLIALDISSE